MSRADRFTFTRKIATVYSDFTLDLDLNPETESLVVLVNEEDIKSRLRNLLLIRPMELPYTMMGSRIQNMLFDLAQSDGTRELKDEIALAINSYEKAVSNVRVNADFDTEDANTVRVQVIFDITNVLNNVVLNTLVRRVR